MHTLRPIEDYVIYKEQKKDRLISWAAVPVSDGVKVPKEIPSKTSKTRDCQVIPSNSKDYHA